MSLSILSNACSTEAWFGLLAFEKEADHERCPVRETRPGVLGGWVCSCPCHTVTGGDRERTP